ncbi:RING-type E3 ubiquitin-protein ligase ppil2 [Clonorchis sinensis]|uniref:RING-type E3 ubiquitin-protein ligase PPIL2 n=1 Tax=Clonorchis sinensis TaxID=79923 RepID=A0A8T1MTA5_CLOSI|nr:RING-type E3 ubiquitin-protein ligase ppil2 [Clonorchis sinensis]
MGKKQHQKDKIYVTCTEWSTLYGGKRASTEDRRRFKRLPFHCCSITFQPFKTPYCTREGIIFDLENILPFVRKHGINPVTGKKMKAGELIKLTFHRNSDGKFHCPVTFKVFNENTHIVAIKVTGNVYCYEAVERLNVKANNYFDLLSSDPFTKEDIITLQDPQNLDKFNISAFYHVQHKEEEKNDGNVVVIRQLNQETKETLAELSKDLKVPDYMWSNKPKSDGDQKKRDVFNTATYSTGKAAASLTSTVMEPVTKVEPAVLEDDVVRYKYVTKKGYVSLVTTHGRLNLELHCDLVPKTCENFIRHCASGYYNETIFHRLIRYFIIQGGDPSGTGFGGESIWNKPFADEFLPNLGHDARGILSMANSGPNTNQSQFFITFRKCKHLDKKHTVFGKVVGGMETLNKVEMLETDKDDRPLEEIQILNCEVFVDPFKDVEEMLAKERARGIETEQQEPNPSEKLSRPKPGNRREEEALEAEDRARRHNLPDLSKVFHEGIGKFINISALEEESKQSLKRESSSVNSPALLNNEVLHKKQKTVLRSTLSDFSMSESLTWKHTYKDQQSRKNNVWYLYIRNVLLTRLLKTLRQLTTGFAHLGAHHIGAITFTKPVKAYVGVIEANLPDAFFTELDCYSTIQTEKSVLERLINYRYPQARIRRTFTKSFLFSHSYFGEVSFSDSREFLCSIAQKDVHLTPLTILQLCMDLSEWGVVSSLLDKLLVDFHTYPLTYENGLGLTCKFQCVVLGKPKPLFYWCFHSRRKANKHVRIESRGILHHGWLHLTACNDEDDGEYFCCVLNSQALGTYHRTTSSFLRVEDPNFSSSGPISCYPPPAVASRSLRPTASSKFALLIGNAKFDEFPNLNENTSILHQLARGLAKYHYQVLVLQDLSADEILRAVAIYENFLNTGAYGFFYIGSHGIRINGQDYAIATDAKMSTLKNSAKRPSASMDGFISIDAISCRFQARNPSLNVMVIDTCRAGTDNEYNASRSPLAEFVQVVSSNLFRLYACQANQVAYEAKVSLLSKVLKDCINLHATQTVTNFLSSVHRQFVETLKKYWKILEAEKLTATVSGDVLGFLNQELDLQLPKEPRELHITTLAGNSTTPYGSSDIFAEYDSAMYRSLSDPTSPPVPCRYSSSKLNLWDCCLWSNISTTMNSLSTSLNMRMEENTISPNREEPGIAARKWVTLRTSVHNRLDVAIRTDPLSHTPRAYFNLNELRRCWESCDVQADPLRGSQHPLLVDHHSAVSITKIQRLQVRHKGNDRLVLQLHKPCQQSLQMFTTSTRSCHCSVIPITIDCPPIVNLWSMDISSGC